MRNSEFSTKIRGKVYAARSLLQFARYFSNWREVWHAYRLGGTIPTLEFRSGLKLVHGQEDDAILLFREMFVDRPYTRNGFYDPKPGDTIVDLGANIGGFALYILSRTRGLRIHCFEPALTALERLRKNIEINHLESSVGIYPFAVSDRSGTSYLSSSERSIERMLLPAENSPQRGAELVSTVTLEEALAIAGVERVDLLKMDVEGAEVEAVTGASPAFWIRINRIAMEYHDCFRPDCSKVVSNVLRAGGFGRIHTEALTANSGQGILWASK